MSNHVTPKAVMPRQKRKTLEERIADRQARRPPLKEGKDFEHGPAKFVFIFLIVFVVGLHLIGLVILMMLGLH
jgi:cytochrome b561